MEKRRRSNIAKIILGVVLIAGCLCQNEPIQASEDNVVFGTFKETIRIGMDKTDGYLSYNKDGKVVGYDQDYLQTVANITGWDYEYVEIEDYDDGLDKLKNREIDLLGHCLLTEKNQERFSYSAYSYGTEYATLVTTKENEKYDFEDYDAFRGMTVALVRDYTITDCFMEYMDEHNFYVKPEYCNTPEEALALLDSGEVEAAVISLMMCGEDYKILARFAPNPFYFMTWEGNEEILTRLNEAMQSVKIAYPGLENDLMQTYCPRYNYQFFSAEEKEFVKTLGTLKVGYIQGRSPISFCDEKTGELAGVTRDIFDEIQRISGLQFEYVPIGEGEIGYFYIRENDLDLITGVELNAVNRRSDGLVMSNPYFSSRKVFVARNGLNFDRNSVLKVALSTGSQTLSKVILEQYPNFEIVEYNTVEESFEALRSGETDLLIQNQYVVENWLKRPKYEQMRIIPAEGMDDKLCFSMVLFEDKNVEDEIQVINIINKAISQISTQDMDNIIVTETMRNKYQYTLADFFYYYRGSIGIGTVFLVFLLGTGFYIMRLKGKQNALRREEERRILLQQKRYQLIMNGSDEMIYEVGVKEDSWISSQQMQTKFGWELPKKIDKIDVEHLMKIFHVHPEDEEIVSKAFGRIIGDRTPGEIEVRLETKEKEYIWCKVSCLPLLDDEQEFVSVVGKIEDVDCEVRERVKLRIQSRTDGLTGLINKRTFIEETKKYLSEHTAVATGIIFIDLDHFKDVNDILGHAMGDFAIQKSGQKLQVIFANYDLVARFGGDEFCIFVKDIPRDTLLDKLGWAVDKLAEVFDNEKDSVMVTASIGAVYCLKEGMDYETMLNIADSAVYEAKRKGRNRFVLKEER